MLKIGVTGSNGGGKDTFANYLVSKKDLSIFLFPILSARKL